MKKIYVAFMLMSFSVFVQAQDIVKFKVKENKVPCEGLAPIECLQIKEGKEKEWKNFYSSIEGFDFVPGYTYRLKVEKTKKVGTIPADASAYSYKLKKVVCKKKVKSDKKAISMDFLNKKLIVKKLNGKALSSDKIYFTFNANDQTIFGKSGCNSFNASYKLSGNTLNINPGITTLMVCDETSMKLEDEFNKTIVLVKEVEQNVNKVYFKDAQGKVVLETTIPTSQDIWSFIDGKEWKLYMLENVGMDYGNTNITFNVKENKVTGNAGCNNFFGEFTTTGDQITFKGLGSTRKMCADEEVMKNEAKFLQILTDATVRFDVAEQTLNFYKGDRLVMMFGLKY